ncbi:MAG: DNA repair protein RecO, partial [Dehalococcoidia bacterium]
MTSNRVYRTKAVVLKQMPIGETNRIITFYTRSVGKVAAVARGVRRPGSKFGG